MEVLQRTANRGSISTGYDIDNSLKFETANTESLTKSQTASNRRTWTVSFWFKKTKVDSATQYIFEAGSSSSTLLSLFVNGTTDWRIYEYVSGSRNIAFYSTAPLNDSAAWYHMVIACDTTQSDAANRFKIYLNGVNLTAVSGYFSTTSYPAQNYETHINSSSATLSIGKAPTASTNFCGYISEFNFIDGLMKDAEDFGKYDSASGIWTPIEYTGSYGNEGYFLNFADSANLGDDASGNSNNFTENNITSADHATDTPTNNFCTLNMLDRTNGNSKNQEGATNLTTDGGSGWCTMMATMGVTKGKWYWEYFKTSNGGSNIYFGIAASDDNFIPYSAAANYYIGNVAEQSSLGFQVSNNTIANSNNSSAFALLGGEVLRVALDMDNMAIYFGKSSSTWASSGDPTSGSSKTGATSLWPSFDNKIVLPGISVYQGGNAKSNFGGYASYTISSPASDENGYGTFEHAPPTGYYALCTKNLAEYG